MRISPRTVGRAAWAVILILTITMITAQWHAWEPLVPTVARTVWTSVVAAVVAASVGGLLAFAHRIAGTFAWIVALTACLPLVIPSAALATALVHEPFGMDPYGPAIVVAAHALSYLPVAFVLQAVALASVTDEILLVSASLGAGPFQTAGRVLRGPWARSFAMSVAVAALFIASDPSVTLVYGGTDSYIASHLLRGMSTGLPVGPALYVLILPTLALTLVVTTIDRGPLREPFRGRAPEFVTSYLGGRRLVPFLVTPMLLSDAILLAIMVRGSSPGSLADGLLVDVAGTTLAVVVLVIPAALVGGFVTTFLARRGPILRIIIGALLTITFLLSQSVIGMMLSAAFRDSTEIGSVTVLPALVGGGALAGGYLAVGLAYLSAALPIAHAGMMIMVRDLGDLVDAARDAGSDRIRAGFVLAPVLAPRMAAVMAIMSGIILTRTAPVIFVQPPGFETASTSLTALAAAGWDDRVFALSLVTALAATLLFVAAAAVLKSVPARTGERND